MKTIVKIDGMKCKHCASHVQETLSELTAVSSVKVNLHKNEAIIKHKEELDNEQIKNAISSIGYQVVEIITK